MAGNKKRAAGKPKIRKAHPKEDGLAKRMLGHFIPYEVGMMRALHRRLTNGSPSQVCRNAAIESFHVHARNLMEFFKDDKQCAIDPRAFTNENYQIEGDFIPRKLETKISQQIVHLTHERTDIDKDKLSDDERCKTLACVENQIERFEKSLRPEWLSIWREGLRKMNFEGPTGPTQTFDHIRGATGPAKPSYLDIPTDTVVGATNQIQAVSSEPAAICQNSDPETTAHGPGVHTFEPD